MIILSQDKKHLINFDNLTQIYITQDEEETEYEIRCETVGCLYETLGMYKTEERAKEVLREIMLKNGSCNAYKIADDRQKERIRYSFAKSFIRDNEIFDSYTMPQE